jgi:hypothetical protein
MPNGIIESADTSRERVAARRRSARPPKRTLNRAAKTLNKAAQGVMCEQPGAIPAFGAAAHELGKDDRDVNRKNVPRQVRHNSFEMHNSVLALFAHEQLGDA